jgi:hypothetical protein
MIDILSTIRAISTPGGAASIPLSGDLVLDVAMRPLAEGIALAIRGADLAIATEFAGR